MKTIINLFMLCFSCYIHAEVFIYSNGITLLGLEKSSSQGGITSTIYGGSNNASAISPADCVIKYELKKSGNSYVGTLQPFTTNLMSYSEANDGETTFDIDNESVVILADSAPDVCPFGSNFSGEYKLINNENRIYKSYFDILIKLNHINSLSIFKKYGALSASIALEPYMQDAVKNNHYYADVYNDYGFFLQQAGKNEDAISILGIVVSKSPKRTVSYLNLGDAYWGVNQKKAAIENYKHYASLMRDSKNKIPVYVMERINQ